MASQVCDNFIIITYNNDPLFLFSGQKLYSYITSRLQESLVCWNFHRNSWSIWSESGHSLQQFSWHSNVNVLLELPQDIKQCICAECSSKKCAELTHHQSFIDNPIISKRRISQGAYLHQDYNFLLIQKATSMGYILHHHSQCCYKTLLL